MTHRAARATLAVVVAIAAVLALLAGISTASATYPVTNDEVRISARLLEDGRVEFALQRHIESGDWLEGWSDRILPRSRNFPVDAIVGRWLRSSPIPLVDESEAEEWSSDQRTGRIEARKLADGRIEFGYTLEGSERVLPSSRFFPPDAAVGRWLNSSTISAISGIRIDEGRGWVRSKAPYGGVRASDVRWQLEIDPFTDEREAAVFIHETSSNNSRYDPQLVLYCGKDGRELLAIVSDTPLSSLSDRFRVSIRWDSEPAQTLTWREYGNGWAASVPNPAAFRRNIGQYGKLTLRLSGFTDSVTATFGLANARYAPTWPNILACGS